MCHDTSAANKSFDFFVNVFNTKAIKVFHNITIGIQSCLVGSCWFVLIKIFYWSPILYNVWQIFWEIIPWLNSFESRFVIIHLYLKIRQMTRRHWKSRSALTTLLYALITPVPADISCNKLVRSVPNNIPRNPPVHSLVSFSIIRVMPLIIGESLWDT